MKPVTMKPVFITALIAFSAFSLPSHALDGRGVMQKVIHAFYYQGEDQRSKAHMTIIDQQGRERLRNLSVLRRNSGNGDGKQKYYLYFNKPSDVKKMVFMAWKNVDQDDDRWLYLPALDLVKRIAASDERTSFVGSHFFYEDVSGRGLDEDEHKLIDENDDYYLVKSTPKQPGNVEFSYYQAQVDKKTFLPMKIEYYKEDANYRTYETLQVDTIAGYATVVSAKMEDKRVGGKTIIKYSAIKYSQHLPDKLFSERYLRTPPKKYLK